MPDFCHHELFLCLGGRGILFALDAKKVSFFDLTLVAVSVVTRESKLFEIVSKELYTDVMTPTLCCVVPNAGDC